MPIFSPRPELLQLRATQLDAEGLKCRVCMPAASMNPSPHCAFSRKQYHNIAEQLKATVAPNAAVPHVPRIPPVPPSPSVLQRSPRRRFEVQETLGKDSSEPLEMQLFKSRDQLHTKSTWPDRKCHNESFERGEEETGSSQGSGKWWPRPGWLRNGRQQKNTPALPRLMGPLRPVFQGCSMSN
mmetsp:Transcript_55743/g.120463  ORF Transcript_55743/g.120463 Transcript_55743/m.120463 type:complete len:183 (-) Transcript_55743:19-567(-)